MVGRFDELDRRAWTATACRAANMFCLDEPDRHPASARERPHARVRRRSNGRLIPFVRLDLTEGPIEEAKRCLDRGARGIKLHPRAQKFHLERRAARPGVRARSRAPRPDPHPRRPRAAADRRQAGKLVDDYPGAQLIIAHAGIADLAELAGRFAGKAGVFFDTSVWSPVDLLSLFRLVPPEQVVYASDYPYGKQPQLAPARAARRADRRSDEPQIARSSAGNANRIADGEEPLEPSQPQGSRRSRSRSRRRASTSTSRWRCRFSSRASRTASARSVSRSTRRRSRTDHARSSTRSASCSSPRATSGDAARGRRRRSARRSAPHPADSDRRHRGSDDSA